MVSPVFGLRPLRALREDTANVPNPEMFTLSPLRSAFTMSSKIVLTARSACPLARSSLLATDSIRSAFVMSVLSPSPLSRWRGPLYQPPYGVSMRDDVWIGRYGGLKCRGRNLRRGRRGLAEVRLGVLEHQG